jgi:L-alanine-DL-glutamate epimerase-like enolase superfamily enzyme
VPPTIEPATVGSLRTALVALPLLIETVDCEIGLVPVPAYPGGPRPTSLVRLRGGAETGRGEHVGWTEAAHLRFRERAAGIALGRWQLGRWADTLKEITEPQERAALEAAAIDLALRQQGTTLLRLAGIAPRLVRYVVSFERVSDPVAEAARHPGVELKIDADPAWSDGIYQALGALRRVAVLDFKGAGTTTDHERAHRAVPDALIEDPGPCAERWPESLRDRVSVDAPIISADALSRLPAHPAAVNLKPARMGGVLAVLECAERCAREHIGMYIGGMFEVDVGRTQLQALAGVLCPDAPNDVAPIAIDGLVAARPERLTVDGTRPGFGRAL